MPLLGLISLITTFLPVPILCGYILCGVVIIVVRSLPMSFVSSECEFNIVIYNCPVTGQFHTALSTMILNPKANIQTLY